MSPGPFPFRLITNLVGDQLPYGGTDNCAFHEATEMEWKLWVAGPIERKVEGISPLLASWEKSSHPAQIRLRSYLEATVAQLLPLPDSVPLFLHLDVDVGHPERLLHHYDLENYLTPLFGSRWLPSARFAFVSARKFVGGGSRIACGVATPSVPTDEDGWSHFSINAGCGASHRNWKERTRSMLASTCPSLIPPGPARVRLAWRCAARRHWCALWKPTGDAMGPVLGVADLQRPYQLDDDRIVDLEFHRDVDNDLGRDVVVGMWWRAT
jgi:hypothetical protein